MWESKVAPLTGVVFALLLLASFAIDSNTDFMPPADEVVAHLSESPGAVMTSAYLRALAAAALVWFSGSLYASLRRDDEGVRLPVLALAGAAIAASLTAVGAVATLAAAERVWMTGSIDSGSAAALFDLSGIATGNGAPIGFAVMIGAAGTAWLKAGRGPRWAAWASVVLAVALLSPYAWVVLAAVIVWVPAAGISMYRNSRLASRPVTVS